MKLSIMENVIYQVTSITHETCKLLSNNNNIDVEVNTTIDELTEETIGFDCIFFDVETTKELLSMSINIPVKDINAV